MPCIPCISCRTCIPAKVRRLWRNISRRIWSLIFAIIQKFKILVCKIFLCLVGNRSKNHKNTRFIQTFIVSESKRQIGLLWFSSVCLMTYQIDFISFKIVPVVLSMENKLRQPYWPQMGNALNSWIRHQTISDYKAVGYWFEDITDICGISGGSQILVEQKYQEIDLVPTVNIIQVFSVEMLRKLLSMHTRRRCAHVHCEGGRLEEVWPREFAWVTCRREA